MPYNKIIWGFIAESEKIIADHLLANVGLANRIEPGATSGDITTPSISVRNTSVNPFTTDAAIVAHVHTTTAIVIRTAIRADHIGQSRAVHQDCVAEVMGCLLIVDETTGENALHTVLNELPREFVGFSQARWTGNTAGIDEANQHLITRIELETLIHPKQTGA